MTKRTKTWFRLFLAVLLGIISVTPSFSCLTSRETSIGELREIQYREEPAYFSLKYPAEYQVKLFTSQARHGIITLTYDSQTNIWLNKLIDIEVYETTATCDEITIENILDIKNEYTNFKLIDKKATILAGYKAFQFSCTFDPSGIPGVAKDGIIIAYEKEIIMVHNGVVWDISILSQKDQMMSANYDFDHLLQTFKLMN
jgi:hypothetical protein